MGSGTFSFKKLPRKKKVYGDKDFFINPITYGFSPNAYEAIRIRPSDDKDFNFEIEGEFSMGSAHLAEVKKEYADIPVKYIYFREDVSIFTKEQLEQVKNYCDTAI